MTDAAPSITKHALPPFAPTTLDEAHAELVAAAIENERIASDLREANDPDGCALFGRLAGHQLVAATSCASEAPMAWQHLVNAARIFRQLEHVPSLCLVLESALLLAQHPSCMATALEAAALADMARWLQERTGLRGADGRVRMWVDAADDLLQMTLACCRQSREAPPEIEGQPMTAETAALYRLNHLGVASAMAASASVIGPPHLLGQSAAIAAYLYAQIGKPLRASAFVWLAKQRGPMPDGDFAAPGNDIGPDLRAFCEENGIVLPKPAVSPLN